jgi:predicted metalloprotease with PDZ domain
MKHMDHSRGTSFATSIGFTVNGEGGDSARGMISNVIWDSAAFKAGVTPEMQVQAVNDQAFNVENLRAAILAAEKDHTPIRLLVKRDNEFRTVNVDYHGGLRYPHLERIESVPDRLDEILGPVQ